MTTGYITLLSFDLQKNCYFQSVVLFEDNSILLLPGCSEKVREGQRRLEKIREGWRRSGKVRQGQRRSEKVRES